MKAYKLYEVSDGVTGTEVIMGHFTGMPEAVLAWWRAFGGPDLDDCKANLLVYEALPDGSYGSPYGVRHWEDGNKPSVYPMNGAIE